MIAAFHPAIIIGPAIGVAGIAVSTYLWRQRRGPTSDLISADIGACPGCASNEAKRVA